MLRTPCFRFSSSPSQLTYCGRLAGPVVAAGLLAAAGLGVAGGLLAGVAAVFAAVVGLTAGVGRGACPGAAGTLAAAEFALASTVGAGTSPLIDPVSQIFAKLSFVIVNWIRPPSDGANGAAGRAIDLPLIVSLTA